MSKYKMCLGYVDSERGDDITGQLSSYDHPFKTVAGAAAKRIDGQSMSIRHNSALVAFIDEHGDPEMQAELDVAFDTYVCIQKSNRNIRQ